MMLLRRRSIFLRLLLAISGTALLVAVVSGSAHYLFAASLIDSSVRTQMAGALATSMAYLERRYGVPVSTDLRVLASSPGVLNVLESMGPERFLDRPHAEGLFLSVAGAEPELYRSLLLLDAAGEVRVYVMGGKRLRPELMSADGRVAELFADLAAAGPGAAIYRGPLHHADGRHSILAGIAVRDPDVAGVGGAVVAELPLDRFIEHLRGTRVLGHEAAWIMDTHDHLLLVPPSIDAAALARAARRAGDPRDGAVLVATQPLDDGSLAGLFRLGFYLPEALVAASMSRAELITIAVLALVFAGSTLIALVLARQIARPIRALSRLAAAVAGGDLSQRIEGRLGAEEGRLASAFNRMLDVLDATTVSRAYVNTIIESMGDAVIVVDRDGVIETVNRAACRLFGVDAEALEGERVEPLLPCTEARSRFAAALDGKRALDSVQAVLRCPDGREVSVWLSCSPMGEGGGAGSGMVVVARDVTELFRAQRQVEQAHRALSFHVENSPLAVIEWDAQFRVRRWSGRAESMFGWSAGEVIGRGLEHWRFVFEDDRPRVDAAIEALRDGEPRNLVRNRNYRKDGSIVHCEWHNSLLLDEHGVPVSVLSLVQDVTESARLSEKLSYQATHDALTGLHNRRAFDQRLEEAVNEVRGNAGVCHVLCFLDLDQFKVVNDSCGHAAGDELLRQVGRLLEHGVRRNDTVARLGGDEFAVLMEHCEIGAAREVAAKLLGGLRDYPYVWEGRTFRISASMGLVALDASAQDVAGVLSAADAACIAAKHAGRDRIHVFDDHGDLVRLRGEAQWVSRINQALEEDRFFLMAQPIVPAGGRGPPVDRYEMLLRMTDEDGQVVSPGAFLPSAERFHLMPKLDRWVIRSTIDLLAASPPAARDRVCFVNVSGQTLADESLRDFVAVQLERTGVAPRSVCFEITETAAVADFTRANAFIRSLSQLGCRFALDDFGAGVSSFAYLKNLPVHFLKIDGMFVRDVATDPTSLALVRSINEVGHAMGKRTVAEFVEDAEILDVLERLGVDFVQGFHIGRPVLAASVLAQPAPARRAAG